MFEMENERRVKSRYQIELNARYQILGAADPVAGVGQTVNLSSSGMFLACPAEIPAGTRLKVFVEWPTLLNGTTPLQLITVGRVVRRAETGVSIAFESYQFRTRSKYSNVTVMPEGSFATYPGAQASPLPFVAKSSV
jgi:hypothetical protein